MLTKKQKILYFLISVTLLIIGFIIGNTIETKEETNCNETCGKEEVVEKKTQTNKTLYYTENGRKIYLYGIERVTVNKQSLTKLDNIFEEVANLANEYKLLKEYDDGGSKLYQINDENKVDEKVNMLVCNTLEGNKDIYFGNTDMKYETDFCKTNNRENFTKTYNVINVLESNNEEIKYLVLRAFQKEEVAIVKIKSYLIPKITGNDTCEFTFQYTKNLINNNSIESIFENTELIKVEKTDKLGLEQTNDKINDEYLIKE